MIKNLPAKAGDVGSEDALEKEMQLTPVFLPRKSYEGRGLAGYSPWGHKESDMT